MSDDEKSIPGNTSNVPQSFFFFKLAGPGFEPGSQKMVFWSFLWSHVSFYFIGNQNLFFTQSQKKFVFFSTKNLSLSSTGKPQRRTFGFFARLSFSLSLSCAHSHTLFLKHAGWCTYTLSCTHSALALSPSFLFLFQSFSFRLQKYFCFKVKQQVLHFLLVFVFVCDEEEKKIWIKKFRSNKKKKLVLRKKQTYPDV